VNVPWQSARHGRGVLLLRGAPDQVARWAARGLVASRVVPVPGWTAVVPAESESRAQPPYDDALTVLAGRPVAHRLRTSLGLFAVDGRAIVAVQPTGWRPVHRWLVWQPGAGVVRTPHLRVARPVDLIAAARASRRGATSEVAGLLADPRGDALGVLTDLMSVLGLPGSALLTGAVDATSGQLVEPKGTSVARFDALMLEEARQRAETEED
jgi:hypothetical protein